MARALSAYNRHVKSFARTYKGKNLMKAAATAWNKRSGKPKTATRRSTSPKKKGKSMGKNGSKMFRTLGAKGAIEDFAWGFGGLVLMGRNNPVALPTVRLVQGIQGHVFGRTGKGRMVYALIDLADLIIAGAASTQSIFDSLRQLTKIQALIPA